MEWRALDDIRSEADLWEILETILDFPDATPSAGVLQIEGWQPELLYFPDEEIGHSISPRAARGLVDFHRALSRAYALAVYGKANASSLRAADRECLDLTILITSGSAGAEVVWQALDKLLKGLANKVTGRQAVAVIIVFFLLFFGADVMKQWLSERQKTEQQKIGTTERVALSEEETRRAKILADTLNKVPEAAPIASYADEGREALVGTVTTVPRARVIGIEISGEEARAILSKPRQEGLGKRVDGRYEVIEIGTENPEGYLGRIRSVGGDSEFDVEINKSDLTADDIEALFAAVREKRPLSLKVNAWIRGTRIVRALVLRAEQDDTRKPPL